MASSHTTCSTCSSTPSGMATALSIDQWYPTKESHCEFKDDPSLSVNFLCMQPSSRSAQTLKKEADSSQPQPRQKPPPSPPDKPTAARFQEIFVDLVGLHCASLEAASPRHILDDRFDSYLDEGERHFKDSLMKFLSGQTKQAKDTHAFRYLEQILSTQMGYRNTFFWANRKNYSRPPRTQQQQQQQQQGIVQAADLVDSKPSPPLVIDNPGHVFVCNASVCDMQCDAFLCPSRISKVKGKLAGSIIHQWERNTLLHNKILSTHIQQNPYIFTIYPDQARVVTLSDWPWKELAAVARNSSSASPTPFVVFGEVSLEKSQEFAGTGTKKRGALPPEHLHILALLETVRQFLDVAIKELKEHQPKPSCFRQSYLLALPVLGTGGGFAGDLMGLVVEQLLSLLSSFVNQQEKVDVVLVCADEATYAHAQIIRQKSIVPRDVNPQTAQVELKEATTATSSITCSFPCFKQLDAEQRKGALRLAKLASGRHLALFLGAGISIGSGLPSWFGLLHMIEDMFTVTGAPSERSLGAKTHWDPLIMADELEEWCRARADRNGIQLSLKERICRHLAENGRRPGLLLSLLISLPCHSMVTQNYDQLIEKACINWNVRIARKKMVDGDNEEGSGDSFDKKKRLSVIPYKPVRESHDWLLKMHGCVSVPDEIILTSKDYAAYDSSRSKALAGLVQASLMTKHMLFVGFSLTDPNYLKIIDQVRHALRPSSFQAAMTT